MAINFHIDSGSGSKQKAKSVNSASATTRAQQAKAALVGQSQASDSGNVAVKSSGILSKVGKFLPVAAEVASNFLPGAAGNIVKGLANAFNDPEWWQSVPGDACTTNQPLRLITGESKDSITSNGDPIMNFKHTRVRPAMAEFVSLEDDQEAGSPNALTLLNPTTTAITQYLMPEIRRVVNAVPLQEAGAYRRIIVANATLYAIWRTLKKYDFLLTHGQTYLPDLNTDAFPILQVANSTKLTALINRLEEFLRSNVRLPHTMCEYLAWRYGRIYKSVQTAKAGLIMYNAYSLSLDVDTLTSHIESYMAVASTSKELQAANADMMNAYFDHDLWVEIRDETQFMFDAKEFALRTNSDVACKFGDTPEDGWAPTHNDNPNPVFIDSSLDNPTVFMASVVSTIAKSHKGGSSAGVQDVLFPVQQINAYVAHDNGLNETRVIYGYAPIEEGSSNPASATYNVLPNAFENGKNRIWTKLSYVPTSLVDGTVDKNFIQNGVANMGKIISNLLWMKPLDIYNKDVWLYTMRGSYGATQTQENLNPVPGWHPSKTWHPSTEDGVITGNAIDMSSISYDMAMVTDETVAVEHVYAFANLVHISRKTGTSYAQAEKLVARDAANMIDKMDVAALATK